MIQGYKELINSIDLHKHLREVAEIEYNYNHKALYGNAPKELGAMVYSDMPKGSRNMKQTIRVIEDIQKWQHQYYLEDEIINKLEEKKNKIDECVNNMQDITVKVAQLRALGLSQEQVSELVHVNERHVRRIEAKLKRQPIK